MINKKYIKDIMYDISRDAMDNASYGYGGPFAAAIVDSQGNIVAIACETILKTKDPTAHAEINAIRKAASILNTLDLSEYILISNCHPCSMCLSAIESANISTVYFGLSVDDLLGTSTDELYLNRYTTLGRINFKAATIELIQISRKPSLQLLKKYLKEVNN